MIIVLTPRLQLEGLMPMQTDVSTLSIKNGLKNGIQGRVDQLVIISVGA
jgi:hypothetical protein